MKVRLKQVLTVVDVEGVVVSGAENVGLSTDKGTIFDAFDVNGVVIIGVVVVNGAIVVVDVDVEAVVDSVVVTACSAPTLV